MGVALLLTGTLRSFNEQNDVEGLIEMKSIYRRLIGTSRVPTSGGRVDPSPSDRWTTWNHKYRISLSL